MERAQLEEELTKVISMLTVTEHTTAETYMYFTIFSFLCLVRQLLGNKID